MLILPMVVYLLYFKWHEGAPFGGREYSQNEKFYYQIYKVFSIDEWIPYVGVPGNSFNFDKRGYVRAYTAEGKFIGEVFASGIPIVRIFWADDVLAVMDGSRNKYGDGRIRLPSTAELPP